MKKILFAILCALGLGIGGASAGSATWTWPAQRTDNTTLPLSAIGSGTVYDTTVPVSGLPGTAVTGCITLPALAVTGSCTATFVIGHTYVILVSDNLSPQTVSALSNVAVAVTVTAPPKAVTDLKVIGP